MQLEELYGGGGGWRVCVFDSDEYSCPRNYYLKNFSTHNLTPVDACFFVLFFSQTDLNSSCGFVLLTNYFVSFSYLKNKSYVKVKWEEMYEALVLRIRGSFYCSEFG